MIAQTQEAPHVENPPQWAWGLLPLTRMPQRPSWEVGAWAGHHSHIVSIYKNAQGS